MKQTDFKIKCIDSSAWLAYYLEPKPEIIKIIEGGELVVTSSLTLFEVKKKLLKVEKDPEELIDMIKQRGMIIVPGIMLSEKAADISFEKNLAAIDALIYTTSLIFEAELITGDNHFRELEKVKII